MLYTTVTIGYDVPWPKVHEALKEAVLASSFVLKNPEPFVLQTSLDDFLCELSTECLHPGSIRNVTGLLKYSG